MSQSLGRGIFGSLKALVDHEIAELARKNETLRRSRYTLPRRILGALVVNRTIGDMVGVYLIIVATALVAEWGLNRCAPSVLPGYHGDAVRGFLTNVGSYFITAQAGILAIVSVAIGVVTLLSQRDDGSSVNTDIRLYYVESYSYELATSGVALLLVLTAQLFWPFQHVLHAFNLGGRDLSFKLVLTAVHASWLGFNMVLFLQFITTTLRFVEPTSREQLRERYSANEVIPKDVGQRLLRALYSSSAVRIFGAEGLKEGPRVTFGYGIGTYGGVIEIATKFKKPKRLDDVWLRPLSYALQNWQRRVRKAEGQPNRRYGLSEWKGHLAILIDFDATEDGSREWVRREGGMPLLFWERFFIRQSFRFVPAAARSDLPTPTDFLDQLTDKLMNQIEKSAPNGFRSALDEIVSYHRFILAAQNTRDEGGNIFNLAEVGGFLSRPDMDWIRQYQRVFVAAADKIGKDTYFIDRLSNLTARLIPQDAANFSQRVIKTILDLGLLEVVALEGWITRRALMAAADERAAFGLAGSDKRAYEEVLISFVGSWETLEQVLLSSFGARTSGRAPSEDCWDTVTTSWPVLQTHLNNAAYFLASAVWNDDDLGAERFRDLLLRWLHPFYAELQDEYEFRNFALLTPDVMKADWAVAQAAAKPLAWCEADQIAPASVFGLMLRGAHNDVICICGAIALHWYVNGQQPSETAARAARLTLQREKLPSAGSDPTSPSSPTPQSTFRMVFDLILRYALYPRSAEGTYGASLDALIRFLNDLSSPRMVPGRIYSGVGLDGFETLRPTLLAVLAATMPASGDEGVGELMTNVIKNPAFSDDNTVRNLISSFKGHLGALDHALNVQTFASAVRVFGADLDADTCKARLEAQFRTIIAGIEGPRIERLRVARLDEAKMSIMRQRIAEAMLAQGPNLTCFREFAITQDNSGAIPLHEVTFGMIDKGSFTTPEMSPFNFNELPPILIKVVRNEIDTLVWQDLCRRPKRHLTVDLTPDTTEFWRTVVAEAGSVGPEPMILVPYGILGEAIQAAANPYRTGGLKGFNVERIKGTPSGGGASYMGTIEGIHVYNLTRLTGMAVLCSRVLLREVSYRSVRETGEIADFEFIDGEDTEKSYVRVKLAPRMRWADDLAIEFQIEGPTAALPLSPA